VLHCTCIVCVVNSVLIAADPADKCEDVEWIQVAEDTVYWSTYMLCIFDFIVVRNFLVGSPTVIVLMRIVYHGIGVLGSLLVICMGNCYIVFRQDIF
jgi:hypothetical protein